jgi:hypothetical protein
MHHDTSLLVISANTASSVLLVADLVNANIGKSGIVVEGCDLAEILTELVLLDIKGDQFPPNLVHLLRLEWGHCLLHHCCLLLDIVPLLRKFLLVKKLSASFPYSHTPGHENLGPHPAPTPHPLNLSASFSYSHTPGIDAKSMKTRDTHRK